jgi:hypothetical protein
MRHLLHTACIAGLLTVSCVMANDARSSEILDTTTEMLTTELQIIKSATKPLPAWAIEIALRAYDAAQTYRYGKRVKEVQKEVLAVLKVVAEIKEMAEAAREMTDREYRLTRELLEVHDQRLEDLTGRVAKLEKKIERPGCDVYHACRNGRCINVANNPK